MNIHQILAFYADNVTLLLEASFNNIQIAISLFDQFGCASGLHCKWEGTKATLISHNLLPRELRQLNWNWELGPSSTKLLGFFFSDGLSPELVVEQLSKILNKRITSAKRKKLSLMARVVIINH